MRARMLLSSSARVSLIWLLALASGDIVSSTCLTAMASSSEDWTLPLVRLVSMQKLLRLVAEGILDREVGRDEESVILLIWVDDDLMVAGMVRDVDISESSRMKVPLLFKVMLQSCSIMNDLANTYYSLFMEQS